MRTASGDSDQSATRDSSAHPGRGPPGKGRWGRMRKGCTSETRQCLNRRKGEEKLASTGCGQSALGHWGWLLPTPKYPAGALQVTKTYQGATRPAPRAIHCLASPLPSSRSTYRSSSKPYACLRSGWHGLAFQSLMA